MKLVHYSELFWHRYYYTNTNLAKININSDSVKVKLDISEILILNNVIRIDLNYTTTDI